MTSRQGLGVNGGTVRLNATEHLVNLLYMKSNTWAKRIARKKSCM